MRTRVHGGGGGGGGISGVTSDGQTPGGEIIAGALSAGDANAATLPTFHNVVGSLNVGDVPANQVDGDDTMYIMQIEPLTMDNGTASLSMVRNGVLNGHNYTEPIMRLLDFTATMAPLAQWVKQNVTQFQIDADGVQVHGKFKTGASVAHSLGSYSGKSVPIYDESGTLLGYMPLYA